MGEKPPGRRAAPDNRQVTRQAAVVPVLVSGLLGRGTRFDERTTTLNVSERGASLHLNTRLAQGTAVMVENLATGERLLFRVVRVDEHQRGGYEIGLEAPEPPANFWRLSWGMES